MRGARAEPRLQDSDLNAALCPIDENFCIHQFNLTSHSPFAFRKEIRLILYDAVTDSQLFTKIMSIFPLCIRQISVDGPLFPAHLPATGLFCEWRRSRPK